MRIAINALANAPSKGSPLVASVVTSPFDRTAADLGLPAGIADRMLGEAKAIGFKGELGESVFVSGEGDVRWYGLVGAGPSPKPTDYRRVGAAIVRLAKQLHVTDAEIRGATSEARAQFVTEGAYLTGYGFDAYKTESADSARAPKLKALHVAGGEGVAKGVAKGLKLAEAVCVGRDLANEHPGKCTPTFLAEQAKIIADTYGLTCDIWDEPRLEKENCHLLLAVGRGSAEESRLIHLTYKGKGPILKRIAYVGKGVTFDSGGYSLKPPASQLNMHLDMGGAAAVLGAAAAIGATQPEGVEVHFIVPSAENLVSSNAYLVNTIIRGRAGISVEIHNTDAEGRLLLADALTYASELEVDEIVDLATLTGACVVALGTETAGLFSNEDAFAARLLGAATEADESMWHMPLTERINDHLKSPFADIKNVGTRWGGAISAGLFLKRFVGDNTWAHIDIAGPGMTDKPWEYICQGGTGFGVLTLQRYAESAGKGE